MTKQYLKHGMVYLTMLNSYEQDVEDLVLDIKARVALLLKIKLLMVIILKQERDSGCSPHPYNHGKMSLDYLYLWTFS